MGLMTGTANLAARAMRRLRTFTRDTRGNVAMMMGLFTPVLIMMTMGGIDIHRLATVRMNVQDALDAATLAAARSPHVTDAQLKDIGWASIRANLANYSDVTIEKDDISFHLTDDEVVVADVRVNVKSIAAHIVLPPYGQLLDDTVPVAAHSEVDRASKNIEVALVLDTTGSMALENRIGDLKLAAKDLVDIVVQDQQTPYYSKVALVPYSMAINAGGYATSARGGYVGPRSITNAVLNLAGSPVTISGATKGNPVVVTASNHGFSTNDIVWISGVSGMTQLNNKAYRVNRTGSSTFELYTVGGSRVNGQNYGTHSGSSGRAQRCQNNDCSVVITAPSHGLQNNDYVRIDGVGGMTELNQKTYLVGNVTPNTYTIDPNLSALNLYTSGGQSYCAMEGCQWFAYENVHGDMQTQEISDCVTERTGAQAYTDAPFSSAKAGRNYHHASSNPCLSNRFYPLSSSRGDIKGHIDGLTAKGSTAGHIGVAWGWYALSPNFSSLFGSAAGGSYNPRRTLKAVVIMTDGEYNSGYCKGVIAKNSTTGSGSTTYHIDCDAPNGHPFDQTLALCESMRRAGVIVYTVGFKVVDDARAKRMVNECATTRGEHVYMAESGTGLRDAFKAIGRHLTQLRISR